MALKALKGGAAAWLSESQDTTEETVEEYSDATPDDVEADIAADLDGKQFELPANQMILVKRAIATLTDLLSVVQGEVETKVAEDVPAPDDEEDDGVQEYDTLVSAIDDLVDESDVYDALIDAAGAIDEALGDNDIDALDKASNDFLDGIQTQMKSAQNVELLRDLASTVADLIEQIDGTAADGGMPDEDDMEKKDEDETKTVLSAEEIAAFVQKFNSK